MGYVADKPLTDLFPDTLIDRAARLITERCQDFLLDRVKKLTPVAQLPAAYRGAAASWVEDRGGRRPGHLRDSWEKQTIESVGEVLRAVVDTDDPVALFVENDTRPHEITASKGGALRFPVGPFFRFAKRVFHPGTEGRHMMRDSLADLEAEFPQIAERALQEVAREY